MILSTEPGRGKKARNSSNPQTIEVTFTLASPEAQEVYLCGDFNDWSPRSLRMIRLSGNGHWEKQLTLAAGRYQYKFVVDGRWIHDPAAHENIANVYGSLNSVLEVSQ
jgi:chromosome partitioning protein